MPSRRTGNLTRTQWAQALPPRPGQAEDSGVVITLVEDKGENAVAVTA